MKNFWKGVIVFVVLILIGSVIIIYLSRTPVKEESASHCTSVAGKEKGAIVLDVLLNKDFEEYSKICTNSENEICKQDFFENKKNGLFGLNFSYNETGIVYSMDKEIIGFSQQGKAVRTVYISEDKGFIVYLWIELAYDDCDLIDINTYTKEGERLVTYP